MRLIQSRSRLKVGILTVSLLGLTCALTTTCFLATSRNSHKQRTNQMKEIMRISPNEARDVIAKNLELLKLKHWLQALDVDLAKLGDGESEALLLHLQKC